MRHSIIEHTRILQELEKSIGCCALSALLSTTNVLCRTKHSVKALIYTSYMMRVIHFQGVFCVIKSVPENVLHFIDTVSKVLNRRISEFQLLEDTRWIYLIKELHVARAQSVYRYLKMFCDSSVQPNIQLYLLYLWEGQQFLCKFYFHLAVFEKYLNNEIKMIVIWSKINYTETQGTFLKL